MKTYGCSVKTTNDRQKTNPEFRKTWKRSGLSLPQVAELLGVSIYTVQSWARPATSKAARQCPREYIALLERAK